MGSIFRPGRIVRDEHGKPVLDADGKPKRELRTQNYSIRIYDANGKPKDIATGSPLITVAKRLLHDLESAKGKGESVGAHVGRVTFDDAAKAVIADHKMNARRSTGREEGRIDLHLTPYFTGWRMTAITADKITAYVVMRQTAGAKSATINRELQILKRAFKLAQRAGKLVSAPYIPKLKESAARQGFFERPEFEATREKLPEHLRGLLTFYYFTGWRSSEALSLEIRQVNLAEGVVNPDPDQSKNEDGRLFDFSAIDELRDVLTAQVASAERLTRETGRMVTTVFHRPDGTPIKSFRKAWINARKDAGYPGKLVHDFRRTAARDLVRSGVPESVAMKLTGHKTRSMFDRYNITSGEDLRAAGEKRQAYATAKAPKDAKAQARVRPFTKRAAGGQ
jgi:integrase